MHLQNFIVSTSFTKGKNVNSRLIFWKTELFQIGSTLPGKNLLLKEQILSFKSLTLLRREAKKEKAEVSLFIQLNMIYRKHYHMHVTVTDFLFFKL